MTKIISDNIGNNSKGIGNPLVPPIDAFFKIRDLAKYAIESGGAHPKSIQEISISLGVLAEQVEYVIKRYLEEQKLLSPFSFYKSPINSKIPSKSITLIEVHKLIKGTTYASVTEQLRGMDDKNLSREYKCSKLDYVTFSGTFTTRNEESLIKHSNFICIDFDDLNNLEETKAILLKDPYTDLLFTSPRGKGLKWVTTFDSDKFPHKECFQGLSRYFKNTYNLIVDSSGKDVCRACFLGHDQNVFINPKYLLNV